MAMSSSVASREYHQHQDAEAERFHDGVADREQRAQREQLQSAAECAMACRRRREIARRAWPHAQSFAVTAVLIALAVLIQTILVALIELQRAAHRLHDGSRRDRRAGEGVEVAAVPSHGPALLWRFGQRQSAKLLQPAGIAILEGVAQAGCFIVANDLDTEQLAARRDGD